MVYTVLLLLITASLLLINNPKDPATRWLAFFMGCGTIGSLAVVIQDTIRPSVISHFPSSELLHQVVFTAQIYSSLLNQLLFPYGALMYAIVSSNLHSKVMVRWLTGLLLMPPIITMCCTPRREEGFFQINYKLMFLWDCPYLVASLVFIIIPLLKEKQRVIKISRLRTFVIIGPTIAAILVANYYAKAFLPGTPYFCYVAIFVAISFVLFVVFSFYSGALGVKLKIEQQALAGKMRAMNSGAAIINHTLKNEISKISFLVNKLEDDIGEVEDDAIKASFRLIHSSTDHLIEMTKRVKDRIETVTLKEETTNVSELLIEVLFEISTSVSPNITVRIDNDFPENLVLLIDPIHFREVIINVVNNAIEAMKDAANPTLFISISHVKRFLTINFSDNGSGIAKEDIKRVVDPFYTTKKNGLNHGLGLSYCHNVLSRHDGLLEIQSEFGKGATVRLKLPNKRVIETNM